MRNNMIRIKEYIDKLTGFPMLKKGDVSKILKEYKSAIIKDYEKRFRNKIIKEENKIS